MNHRVVARQFGLQGAVHGFKEIFGAFGPVYGSVYGAAVAHHQLRRRCGVRQMFQLVHGIKNDALCVFNMQRAVVLARETAAVNQRGRFLYQLYFISESFF